MHGKEPQTQPGPGEGELGWAECRQRPPKPKEMAPGATGLVQGSQRDWMEAVMGIGEP